MKEEKCKESVAELRGGGDQNQDGLAKRVILYGCRSDRLNNKEWLHTYS